MVVSDIDDTLLTDEGVVSGDTVEAIHKALEKGVKVVLATGRMHLSAKQVAEKIGLDLPVISYQGASVKEVKSGEVLYEQGVPTEVAQKFIRFCHERGFHLQVYSNDKLYVKEENDKVKAYCELNDIPFYVEPKFNERFLTEPITKMLIIDDPEVINELENELKAEGNTGYYMTKSKPNFLEFMHQDVNKGAAVHQLCKHYGIDPEEVIGIGDSWNDIPLLQAVGLPVAVGNATQALKDVAKYITVSNNEGGVKEVINKFILEKQ